jgi:hypothetical protein
MTRAGMRGGGVRGSCRVPDAPDGLRGEPVCLGALPREPVALGKNLWHRQSPSARILHRTFTSRKGILQEIHEVLSKVRPNICSALARSGSPRRSIGYAGSIGKEGAPSKKATLLYSQPKRLTYRIAFVPSS